MHSPVDEVIELHENLTGTLQTAGAVKAQRFEKAFVFPNSFRSALIPFLARVPIRIGMPGHQRAWMLTHVVNEEEDTGNDQIHQAWEYVNILGLAEEEVEIDVPRLSVPETVVTESRKRFSMNAEVVWVGIIPGAAHGPSKRWPLDHFIEAGRNLISPEKYRVLVFGTGKDMELCSKVAEGIGEGAVNLAGKTSLSELAALLGLCRVVITNDSGGMHLAAAVGTMVVAVFGATNPEKTGPLGKGHRVIMQEGMKRSRDIERDSPAARESLRSIQPERVHHAVVELLKS